jgi:hypothetical protein
MTFHIKLGMLNVLSHFLLDHLRRLVESDQKPMTSDHTNSDFGCLLFLSLIGILSIT